jgi:hypothetical protein
MDFVSGVEGEIGWDDFAAIQTDSDNFQYVNYVEIGGLRGFDAQFSGQRNRFIYLFHYRESTLNFAISEPTESYKLIADQIISTLKVVTE